MITMRSKNTMILKTKTETMMFVLRPVVIPGEEKLNLLLKNQLLLKKQDYRPTSKRKLREIKSQGKNLNLINMKKNFLWNNKLKKFQ